MSVLSEQNEPHYWQFATKGIWDNPNSDRFKFEAVMGEPRVYGDLMKRDDTGRLVLVCAGTTADIKHYGIVLQQDMLIPFWTDDADDYGNLDPLVYHGRVEFDAKQGYWTAVINEEEIRNLSETK